MRRRQFISVLGLSAAGSTTSTDAINYASAATGTLDHLEFDSSASLLNSNNGKLTTDSHVAVWAESTASNEDSDGNGDAVDYGSTDIPLVAVDGDVVGFGATLVSNDANFRSGNEEFVLNVWDAHLGGSGTVLYDEGHDQYLTTENLSRGQALIVTSPAEAFTSSELSALQDHVDDGGAVILIGASSAPDSAVTNLNDVASGLGSELRLNDDEVTDSTNNVNADSTLPTTTAFDSSYPIFSAYPSVGGTSSILITEIHEDTSGSDSDNLNHEYVVFQNTGSGNLDLTGWTVEDDAGHSFSFPSGFTLTPGAKVTLHTGSGTDSSSDLYWGRGSSVWNNDSDICSVYDDTGAFVTQQSYPNPSGTGDIAVQNVHADASGSDTDNLNDEYVVFENTGSGSLDLSGYTVEDEAAHTYAFPSGFTLDAGTTVTLHSGSGTDSSSDLYWGSGSAIWNNSGDTVYVFDETGSQVEAYGY